MGGRELRRCTRNQLVLCSSRSSICMSTPRTSMSSSSSHLWCQLAARVRRYCLGIGAAGLGVEPRLEKTRIRRSRRREEERRSAGNSGGGVLRNRSANEKKGGGTYSTNTWCRPQVLSVPRTGVIVSTGAKSSRSTCRLPHLDVGRRRIADLIARVSLTHSRITAPCRALSGATACAERVALPGAWRARPRRRFQHAAPRIEANRQSRTRLDAALQLG